MHRLVRSRRRQAEYGIQHRTAQVETAPRGFLRFDLQRLGFGNLLQGLAAVLDPGDQFLGLGPGGLARRVAGQALADLVGDVVERPGFGGLVLGHADHDRVVGIDLDRFGSFALQQHQVGKDRFQHFRLGQHALGAEARKRSGLLQFQAQVLGHVFKPGGVGVDQVDQPLAEFDIQIVGALLAHFLENLGPRLLEGLAARGFDFLQPDQVPAEFGLHRPGNVAGRFEIVKRFLEFRHHHVGLDPAEISTGPCRAGIVGIFPGERFEILALGDSLAQRLRQFARFGFAAFVACGNQDVRSPAPLLGHEARASGFVSIAQVLFFDLDAFGHVAGVELDELDADALGTHELVLVFGIESLDFLGRDLDLVAIVAARHGQHGNLSLFQLHAQPAIDVGVGHQDRAGDAGRQFLDQQIAGQFALERRDALAAGRDLLTIYFRVEPALDLEGGNLADHAGDGVRADRKPHLCGVLGQQTPVDHVFEELAARLGLIGLEFVVGIALLVPQLGPVSGEFGLEFRDRDLGIPDFGHRVLRHALDIAVKPEEHERDGEQPEDEDRNDAGNPVTNGLQHKV